MPNVKRVERRDIEGVGVPRYMHSVCEGQHFCETEKSWEIWQDGGLMIVRLPKRWWPVYWLKEGENE